MFSDGTSFRVTANGLEKQPGIFISRLVPGGLAEGTGLLAVNDEVLEVNGIEVAGKSLDQVNIAYHFDILTHRLRSSTWTSHHETQMNLKANTISLNPIPGDRYDGSE